jgi:hypothetical protein
MSKLELAKAVVDWWTLRSRPSHPRAWFAADFVFDSGIETFGIDGLMWRTENTAPWSDVRVLCSTADAATAAVFFEGVEGVTGLKHRIAWFIQFQNDLVTRLTHVDAIVPKYEGASSGA